MKKKPIYSKLFLKTLFQNRLMPILMKTTKKIEKEACDHLNVIKSDKTGFIAFNTKEVQECIKVLKKKSSPGSDQISNLHLLHAPPILIEIITSLINQTVTSNYIPSEWKKAIITMIPKKANDLSDAANYRPISLTSSLAKLSEKLISIKLKAFLKKTKL